MRSTSSRTATRYMIDYLENAHGMDRTEAYALCSLAGNLNIGAVMDVPHMFVAVHMSKEVLGTKP